MANSYDINMNKMVVKPGFLHRGINENIYKLYPNGFEVEGKKYVV